MLLLKMNIPDHISESLETIFWVKIIKFPDAYVGPDPGIFLTLERESGWKNSHPGYTLYMRSVHKQIRSSPAPHIL
jgi:hypothetical protein